MDMLQAVRQRETEGWNDNIKKEGQKERKRERKKERTREKERKNRWKEEHMTGKKIRIFKL